jgi:formylglycine-generating enzyme required for sulfatase activity
VADKTPGIHAHHGGAGIGKNYGSVTFNNHFLIQSGLAEKTIEDREAQYLRRVIGDCGGLEWLALMNLEEGDSSMGLDAVYTALLTEIRHEHELTETGKIKPTVEDPVRQGRLSAVELLNREQRLVLLGDPGSGKSAFVNFVALCLAGEQLKSSVNLQVLTQPLPDNEGGPQTRENNVEGKNKPVREEVRQDWQQGALIPLRVILRDFSASACFPQEADKPDATHLLEFLHLDLKYKGCDDYLEVLKHRLHSGQVLVMLDGLDEVAQAGDRRKHLVACIDGFVKTFSTCRFLVTCRPYAYRNREWQLPRFVSSKLAEFGRGQIIRFVERWYTRLPSLDRKATIKRGQELQQAVLSRPDLRDLAKRPLLLSLIAYLHAYRHELPGRRADLYERLLGLLVDKWEKARFNVADGDVDKARQLSQASLAEFLQIGQNTIRKVLERLAFQAHTLQDGQQDTADIAAKDLNHELLYEAKEKNPNVNVLNLSEYLRDRVGILYQRGGSNEKDAIYTFPHRSFQEYLSAAYFRREENALFKLFASLTDELVEGTWQELAAQLGRTEPDRWREVVVLAGGINALSDPGPVWNLLKELVDRKDAAELTEPEAWGLRLASEILSESVALEEMNQRQRKIYNKIQIAMPGVLSTSHLVVKERADVGRYLGKIGDPRTALTDVDMMPFCLVPAGPFFMGHGEHDRENEEWSAETPAGEYDLDYDYWLAKYPVTVAQFQAFIDERDFDVGNSNTLMAAPNTPVVYVSQRDALAFCDWLTRRWRKAELLLEGWRVTLPNEPEWEKAARGGLDIPEEPIVVDMAALSSANLAFHCYTQPNPEPQRRYPWGNEIDEECANYDMNVGWISTPGVYFRGASSYGCHDLAGNIWEWTRSEQGDYSYPAVGTAAWKQRERENPAVCVLRGGAFLSYHSLVRCAVRINLGPDGRNYNIGFRVVLSPLR